MPKIRNPFLICHSIVTAFGNSNKNIFLKGGFYISILIIGKLKATLIFIN